MLQYLLYTVEIIKLVYGYATSHPSIQSIDCSMFYVEMQDDATIFMLFETYKLSDKFSESVWSGG